MSMKKLRTAILIAVVSMSLAGCIASVETRPEAIARAKAFVPANGKAEVYVIRESRAFPNNTISVHINEVGDDSGYDHSIDLLPESFGRTEIAPGRYRMFADPLTMSMFDATPEKEVRLEAGDVEIYRLAPENSWSGTVFFLDKLTAEQAKTLIEKHQLSLIK